MNLKPILYYSSFCKHSNELLQYIGRSKHNDNLHFINIDNRLVDKDGQIQIVLEDTTQVPLPDIIERVPSLLLIHKNNMVILGKNILQYLENETKQRPTQQITEPASFDFATTSTLRCVQSDVYSFLDQSAEELSAKGNGGLRQTYNYSTLEFNDDDIITPPENYTPNKISKNVSLDKLMEERNKEVSLK